MHKLVTVISRSLTTAAFGTASISLPRVNRPPTGWSPTHSRACQLLGMNMWQLSNQSKPSACLHSSSRQVQASCPGVACRHGRPGPIPALSSPAQQPNTCTSMYDQQRPSLQQRGMTTTRSSGGASPGPVALSIQLPQFCCGCGVRMQQTDPEAPGYFIVPAKLLEASQGQPRTSPALDEDMDADDYDVAQQDMLGADGEKADNGLPDVLCQRCFALRHAGRVKVEAAEAALPEFDLSKKVGRKIALQKDRRAVVLLVVDASDFDGSLPREALKSLYPPGYDPTAPVDRDDPDSVQPPVRFKLMVALNKVDLLPREATEARLVQWVRIRMNQAGLPRPDKVYCVSANKGSGIKEMLEGIKTSLGFRGDLWVVGAQNAGKSSVISAMKRLGGTAGKGEPTIAPLAGTTLGLINVPGLPLGPKHRAFDTPGVAHTHQLTGLLTTEEVRQVLPGKSMVGRTYRTTMGHTLLLGGLARVDIVDHPGATMYLTVFVSSFVNLHLGKTDGADERVEKLVAGQLGPPADVDRWKELPAWEPRRVQVEGTAWDKSTVDVHIAGLGWVALGVRGPAELIVWAAPQVAVTTRPALVPDYAKEFCRPGFSILLPTKGKQGPGAGAKDSAPLKKTRSPSRRA